MKNLSINYIADVEGKQVNIHCEEKKIVANFFEVTEQTNSRISVTLENGKLNKNVNTSGDIAQFALLVASIEAYVTTASVELEDTHKKIKENGKINK